MTVRFLRDLCTTCVFIDSVASIISCVVWSLQSFTVSQNSIIKMAWPVFYIAPY